MKPSAAPLRIDVGLDDSAKFGVGNRAASFADAIPAAGLSFEIDKRFVAIATNAILAATVAPGSLEHVESGSVEIETVDAIGSAEGGITVRVEGQSRPGPAFDN